MSREINKHLEKMIRVIETSVGLTFETVIRLLFFVKKMHMAGVIPSDMGVLGLIQPERDGSERLNDERRQW